MEKWHSFNKRSKKYWRSVSSNIVRLFGCFIVDVPATKLLRYMRKPLELLMMTFQHFIDKDKSK